MPQAEQIFLIAASISAVVLTILAGIVTYAAVKTLQEVRMLAARLGRITRTLSFGGKWAKHIVRQFIGTE